MLGFKLLSGTGGGGERAGTLETRRGPVETPVFMPVGTLGSVKSLSPEDLRESGARIILGNTYHLYLRPGCDVIRVFSGLHRFIGWDGPILTDSGGFQIFSLAKLSKTDDAGAVFQSHIDGSTHVLTPEGAIEIQLCLGSDIMMCLDDCIAYPSERSAAEAALVRTTAWALRCRRRWEAEGKEAGALFGIVQGGMYPELRAASAAALLGIGFPGYAVGGLSVGEPKALMMEIAAATLPLLPPDKPRYVMGVGSPEDLVQLVSLGADMFDCVLPTRNARNGQLFTEHGNINIGNARYRFDPEPVEAGCACYTCRTFSRAYLRHLFTSKELLAYRLNTIHNVHYYTRLMARMRCAILAGEFEEFRRAFHGNRNGRASSAE